ncbi:alpha/beta fold hydrolase [Agilicoccus flavus]|uniref:alpha/beta fold hydrolase n=1 Tax=Agilicoccus flavus TaxID=2775968 RepID=UPI001CF6ABAD|nr:alpha/beta fold hydrolase [Agilicoccus flavus]
MRTYPKSCQSFPRGIMAANADAVLGTYSAIMRGSVDFWTGVWSRGDTPLDVMTDVVTWAGTALRRERPQWAHAHDIVREWPAARLRDFSAADADPNQVATVFLPPQAGHDSSIVDYSAKQSQVMTARAAGLDRVFSLDWKGATQATKHTTIDDYMDILADTAAMLGGRVNLVGDCQGGWLATIYAAMYPDTVNSLTIAGAPIDYHAGEPLLHDWVRLLAPDGDMSFYRNVVATHDGLLPGDFLLGGFMALQPHNEVDRQLQLLANIGDEAYVARYRQFETWFQWTQALPGDFYLWVVEHLFMHNELIAGTLQVQGRHADLGDITCPLFLLAGSTDHITPAPQVWALADHTNTPEGDVMRRLAPGGHLGLFMGTESLREHWRPVFERMATISGDRTPVPA